MSPQTQIHENNPNETTSQEAQIPAHPHPRVDWDAILPAGHPLAAPAIVSKEESATPDLETASGCAAEIVRTEVLSHPVAAPTSAAHMPAMNIPTGPSEALLARIRSQNRMAEAPRRRCANPAEDNIWTRHHAFCLMGAICDIALGGYEAARAVAEPLKAGVKIRGVIATALDICPWLLNATYLNFIGSAGLEEQGLEGFYLTWAANRVYYFYREPSEHPVHRKKSNLCAVYGDFYCTFAGAIEAGTVIEEERAKEFWIAVSNRVPFRLPAPEMVVPAIGVSAIVSGTALEGGVL